MSKHIEKLTEEQVMRAFAEDKPRKRFDGAGLYVILFPSGLKSWRMKYRDERGKEMTLTFGRYPEVSLVLARYRCSIARQMLNEGRIREESSIVPTPCCDPGLESSASSCIHR